MLNNEIYVNLPVTKVKVKDASCDSIEPNLNSFQCPGFHGVRSIKTDKEMRSLTGITLSVFLFLTNLLLHFKKSKLNHRTKLLTLMKLKTGLSYSAIAVLFNIHMTTVQRTFIETLDCLRVLLEEFIFWPSKETIQATLPDSFKKHYSNTRVIIDCTEVKTEIPPTVKHSVLMYSQYKHSHTTKFLVGCALNGFVSYVSK